MSALTSSNPTSPLQTKDIRSFSRGNKRTRDHASKWSAGARPLPSTFEKLRPAKPLHSTKAQKSPHPAPNTFEEPRPSGTNSHTPARKTSGLPNLSTSLTSFDAVPQEQYHEDTSVLYSWDTVKRADTAVPLGGLVEKAEEKWVERVVRKEWAVVDREVETPDEDFVLV